MGQKKQISRTCAVLLWMRKLCAELKNINFKNECIAHAQFITAHSPDTATIKVFSK
jgi:hypothetical protein